MKYKWLNSSNNDKLIVFFNGWGLDASVVSHLLFDDYDVVMFYDYRSLETNFMPDKDYSEITLISWSMGVMTASLVFNKLHINADNKIAINGTMTPINKKFGINPMIYDLTIKGFNDRTKDKFIKNMFDEDIPKLQINRSTEELREELIVLKDYSANPNFEYTKVLISDNDKIIPTTAQCSYWGIKPNIKGGHCPFFQFKSWSELL